MTEAEDEKLKALLAWYEAMGVDAAIGEEPVDAFALSQAPVRSRVESRPPLAAARARPAPPPPARGIGGEASTLAELKALVAAFDGCPLKRTAKSLCFSRGSETAPVMLIGEAPGRDEDLQGQPFVGRAGQLLDRMLASIGLSEDDVYITNTVYWRPPGNRTPNPEEIAACAPFLTRQIELVSPKMLVLLGAAAAQAILRTSEGIMRLRGKWLSHSSAIGAIPTIATLHPAYLLRKPEQKKLAWRDLLTIKTALDKL